MSDNHEDQSNVSPETRAAEATEAAAPHQADRPPTPDEEKSAPGPSELDPEVAANYEEMAEKGANVKGEGQLP